MQYVAFFRNVNQGQLGHPTTDDLLDAFRAADARDLFAFRSNGTIVFESDDPVAVLADVRGLLAARDVFRDAVQVRSLAEIRELNDRLATGIDPARSELTLFSPDLRLSDAASVIEESRRRRCEIVAHGAGWAVVENDRDRQSNGTPTIEAILHEPATSRGFPTLARLLARVDAQP